MRTTMRFGWKDGRLRSTRESARSRPHSEFGVNRAYLDGRMCALRLLVQMKTVWRVFSYLKRYPWMAAGTLTCAILSTLMVIVFPATAKWIIDDVVRANRPDKLVPLIMLAAGAFLVQHGFNALRIVLNNTFGERVIFDLRDNFYSHIQLLPLRWFDNRATGDLMTRVIEDVNSVERVLIDGIEQGVTAILQVLIVLSVMFYFDAKLALFALIPFPFL